MKTISRFDTRRVRNALLARGGVDETEFIRYAYRPFDTRWLYWEADSGLLDRPRPDYKPHVVQGNLWLCSAQHLRKGASEPQACFAHNLASYHLIERGALWFPAWLRDEGLGLGSDEEQRRPNLSLAAQHYLENLGLGVEDLFHHVLAVLHDPAYREANAGAQRMEWPRIPPPLLARRHRARSGGGTGNIGGTRPGPGPPAGLGNTGSQSHHGDTATGDSIYRRSRHRRWRSLP